MDAKRNSDSRSHTVEADFLDSDSEIDTDSEGVTVPDAFVSGCQKTDRKVSCSASGLKAGKHNVRVHVKDKAGNRKEEDHEVTITDTAAPVIDSITASPTEVAVSYNDPSPSSGIASVIVTVDGVKLNCEAAGTGCDNDHDDYDEDHDGHDYDRDDYDDDHDGYDDDHDGSDNDHNGYYKDSSGLRHKSDGYYHDSDSDDHDGAESSNAYVCPIVGNLSCGPHQVVVTVTDKAGNVTTGAAVVNGAGDCIAPITADNSPAGWHTADVSVALACTDAGGSGCASTTYEVDGGATQTGNAVSLTADGIHTITYRSTDVAGNVEITKTATAMIDKTPPDVATSGDMTVEATGPSGATADFTSSATDALSGIAGDSACTPISGSTFPLGTSTVSCSATDVAGNTGTATLTVTVVDTTAPVVTYGGPSDTLYTTESPTVTGSATDAVGVASAVASIDGGPDIACTIDAGNISCPTSGVGFGPHAVVITTADAASNAGTATGTFCISSGRPNLTLFKVKGPYLVAGDPSRWVTVDYRMDNTGPAAYNVSMLSMTANNGIYLVSPSPLPALGDIAPGGSVTFSVKYYYPVGVTSYKFTNTACAFDQCFTEYIYP
ncbi:MAG: HYR domain-containing protein [Thermoleophilia bacterium]|nr:HYR domain-containing protein [Thermoleophilia bacterium]